MLSVSERDGRLSSRFLPPLFLLLITCIAYSNANHDELLFDSLLLKSDDTPEMVRSIWQAPLRPGQHISYLTFQLNQAFNKAIGLPLFHVTSFLVVNVLLHALNACLVFYLLRATLREARARRIEPAEVGPREIWIPLAVSTLFAIHPLQASSIVYIFQRRGMLAVTFLLLAVLAYLRVRSRPVGEGRSAWPWRRVVPAAAIPVCYWLSFKSKELGLILPFFLMVIELCLLAPDKRALKRALRWVIPALGLTVVSLIFFLWSRQLFDPTRLRLLPWGPRNMWGPWTQFLTESRVAVHYWKLLLLPLPRWCCIDHEFATSSHLTEHYAFVAIAFHAVLLGLAAVAAWKRYTLVAIGIFWFYIALMPFAVVPQVELLVEYETYLPSIGLALILTEGLIRLRGRIPTQWQVAAVKIGRAHV